MKHIKFDKKFYPYEYEEVSVRKGYEYIIVGIIFTVLLVLAIII
jgi:hypothetical protein